MPRYFFHVFENGHRTKDDVGIELDSDNDIEQEAIHALPEIAKDRVPEDGDQQAFTVVVTGERGQPIYTPHSVFWAMA